MIKIHIYSNNEIRGPFDIDEINFLLRAKKFSPSNSISIIGYPNLLAHHEATLGASD